MTGVSDELPEFLAQTPEDSDEPTITPGAARQRAYRARRNAERNATAESVTPEDESKSNVTSPGVTPLRNTRRNAAGAGDAKRDAKGDGKQPNRRRLKVKMTDDQYAEVFSALHLVAAGVTGVPELAVTDAEAAPVGKALQVCAEYYGWDFVEKLGPIFMLGLTVGTLEMKVMARTKAAIPRVAQAKAEARRRKQERQSTAQPTATEAPPTPTADRGMNPAALLAALEEQTTAIPENLAELVADV